MSVLRSSFVSGLGGSSKDRRPVGHLSGIAAHSSRGGFYPDSVPLFHARSISVTVNVKKNGYKWVGILPVRPRRPSSLAFCPVSPDMPMRGECLHDENDWVRGYENPDESFIPLLRNRALFILPRPTLVKLKQLPLLFLGTENLS